MSAKVPVATCTFLAGYLVKKVNNFLVKISLVFSMRFHQNGVYIENRSGDNRQFTSLDIDKSVVNLKWNPSVPLQNRDIEVDIQGNLMKESLQQIKKQDPVHFKLFEKGNNTYTLVLTTGIESVAKEGYKYFDVTARPLASQVVINEPKLDCPRIFVEAKTFEKQLSSFKPKRPVRIDMYRHGMIILSNLKGRGGGSVERIGELSPSEEEAVNSQNDDDADELKSNSLNVGNCVDALKLMCRIYNSPVSVYYEPGKALTFVTYVSYLCRLKYHIEPE